MKHRLRGGFALGVGTVVALVALTAFAVAVARPAGAMPPHNHTYNCHGPKGAK